MSFTIYDAKRLSDSLAVLKLVEEFLRQNPGMRLNQALVNMAVVIDQNDDWNTEPSVILDRVHRQLTDLGIKL